MSTIDINLPIACPTSRSKALRLVVRVHFIFLDMCEQNGLGLGMLRSVAFANYGVTDMMQIS